MPKPLLILIVTIVLICVAACSGEEEFTFSDPLYRDVPVSQMVTVPAGPFVMGSDYSEGLDFLEGVSDEGFSDEWPERTVQVNEYRIDVTEVSNSQYRACVKHDACPDPVNEWTVTREAYYLDSDFDDYPVLFVSHRQAQIYCEWAGKRLPTEAEWEKAARGGSELTYPWGDTLPDCTMANFSKIVSNYGTDDEIVFTEDCFGDTVRVGQYSAYASPYGAYNMAGNAAEWVADWYDFDYYDSDKFPENTDNPKGPEHGIRRVVKGGSFADNMYFIRSAARGSLSPDNGYSHVGFRCAADPD